MTIANAGGSIQDTPSELEGSIQKLARAGTALRQAESSDEVENLGTLLRQVSSTSIREIDHLITDLQTLRRKLQTDGDRIQRDIAEHVELSQQVMQITTIISDSVKKLPGASSISR
jgi:hypothetical protein